MRSDSDRLPRIPSERIDTIAWFVAVTIIFGSVYFGVELLAKATGYEIANAIFYVPAFFAILLAAPMEWRISRWIKKRYCAGHGGHIFGHETDRLEVCMRCRVAIRIDGKEK